MHEHLINISLPPEIGMNSPNFADRKIGCLPYLVAGQRNVSFCF